MTMEEFLGSLRESEPRAEWTPLLRALWLERKGEWERAHEIVQNIPAPNGSWVHAYLHRVEGDRSNAGYWYRQAGRKLPEVALEVEWQDIVQVLLGVSQPE